MKTIIAIYQDGVFRPVEPVHLPEHSRVRVEVEENGWSARETSDEAMLQKFRGVLAWPADPELQGDLRPFVGSLVSESEDPVEWQRKLRDEEWS